MSFALRVPCVCSFYLYLVRLYSLCLLLAASHKRLLVSGLERLDHVYMDKCSLAFPQLDGLLVARAGFIHMYNAHNSKFVQKILEGCLPRGRLGSYIVFHS